MATTYQELINKGGTIYKGDRGYATPAELATDLGIAPHQIDWTQIKETPQANLATMTGEQYLAQGYQGGQPITPGSLSTANKIDISGAPKTNIDYSAIVVDSVNAQVKIDADAAAKKVADEKAKSDAAVSDITGILTQLESEGTDQAQAEQDAGIPAFQAQQADITGQIAVKTAEYNQLKLQEEQMTTTEEGKPISMQHISGNIAQIQREFRSRKNMVASDLGLLQAQSLAISGKQAAAQGAVDRAIDLKYDSLKQQLETKKFLLGIIQDDLTAAEKKQWDYQQATIKQQEQKIADQKAIEKANYTTLLSQINQYPDAGIQLTDSLEVANAKIVANSAIYRQQTRLADTTPGPSPTPTPEGVNPQVDALARSYLRGESLGSLSGSLRGQVLTRAEEIQKSPEYKQQVKVEMRGDIQEAINRKDYTVREDIINRLQPIYTELTLDEIAAEVYGMIPDEPEPEVRESFFERLFGGLIPR